MMGLPVVRHLSRKPRMLVAIGIAAGVFAGALFEGLSPVTSSLLAWNCATLLYIVLAIETMISADDGLMRRRAQLYDDGEGVILAITVLAAILSVVAIVFELATSKQLNGFMRGVHVGLSALTLLTSWAFIHIAFAFHYAHGYYSEGEPDGEDPCLIFPGNAQPNYIDFLYFSFVIGTSGQTADISFAATETRRIGLIHCVLSYLFNATVLALTINIAASLIS
jgi:uncharacterized membrane protein